LNAQQNSKLDTLKTIHKTLVSEKPNSFGDCVAWARLKFEELFHNVILQLLHNFPPDQKTAAGTPFWSGTKRCPSAVKFDIDAVCENAEMRNHFDFIVATANMRALMFGIEGTTDETTVKNMLSAVNVPAFQPVEGVKIAANEAEAKEEKESNNGSSSGGVDPDSECKQVRRRASDLREVKRRATEINIIALSARRQYLCVDFWAPYEIARFDARSAKRCSLLVASLLVVRSSLPSFAQSHTNNANN